LNQIYKVYEHLKIERMEELKDFAVGKGKRIKELETKLENYMEDEMIPRAVVLAKVEDLKEKNDRMKKNLYEKNSKVKNEVKGDKQ